MGSLNFNQNAWYRVNVTRQSGQSLAGTPLYLDNDTKGSVSFKDTNSTVVGESWQFYIYNATTMTYVLRCLDSGPHSYLATTSLNDGEVGADATTGHTTPIVAKYPVADESIFWQIEPWGDGSYYLYNLLNGSDWRLNVESTSDMDMDSNITAPQTGQQFTFQEMGPINNYDFSTYYPYPTSTATASSSATPPTTHSPSPSPGLSTAATAGISIAATVLAISVLGLLSCWFFRRRRRRHLPGLSGGGGGNSSTTKEDNNRWAMAGYSDGTASEMPGSFGTRAELMSSQAKPVELASGSYSPASQA
ncbi:hypothetical protein M406DRAFT_328522 [Cryphonectria parasitica EP155]|uniref:Uncharacterized protein n=1 Tax=Cryphonectria parasitica (strain ATCC 38755 / EP155) TaxID=660469 RepID=A0A9P4Y6V0_CRYP1|nr:uncharacterized protein M406DRAFT_328522 [Cryphonectria parasitica EP155]KAF3767442.1 hypothetical protein M406DRAFT_328522 [Cryphonectria parasitica EP155]